MIILYKKKYKLCSAPDDFWSVKIFGSKDYFFSFSKTIKFIAQLVLRPEKTFVFIILKLRRVELNRKNIDIFLDL